MDCDKDSHTSVFRYGLPPSCAVGAQRSLMLRYSKTQRGVARFMQERTRPFASPSPEKADTAPLSKWVIRCTLSGSTTCHCLITEPSQHHLVSDDGSDLAYGPLFKTR